MKLKGPNGGSKLRRSASLWDGVTEADFRSNENIEDRDIGEFDMENMTLFIANSNLFRHLIRLSDSLKPVERRALLAAYAVGAKQGRKTKCSLIVAQMMKFHPHGDICYGTLVRLAQPWTKQCILFDGKGNFGNAANPEQYAADRYTEGYLSKYAYECFFSDYDADCVEMLFNSAADADEPMSLPVKFPNILVNGGMGISVGNSFKIPPFNINDIIEVVSRVLRDPNTTDVFMVPDFPCDCDIVDDGTELHNMIDTGVGNIRMRGRIEIEPYGSGWQLHILSVPWMVNLQSVLDRIRDLARNGVLAINEIRDDNYTVKANGMVQTKLDTGIIISGAHDPNVIRDKLYSMTELEKTAAVNFKVVTDNLKVKQLNMRDLILAWINERRSYKRRLFSKKLSKIDARLSLLEILIELTTKYNLDKTVHVIRDSDDDEICANLMKICAMSSYQAGQIIDMGLKAFSKNAHQRYIDEQKNLLEQRKQIMKIVGSPKKIDEIILDELQDLHKYATPRRTNVIEPSSGAKIADTQHHLIVSKDGLVKKLMYNRSYSVGMGSFKTGDYPIYRTIVNNLDSVIFTDTFGRYSVVPVHTIDNNEPSQYGHNLFTLTKLSGKIVSVQQFPDKDVIAEISKIGRPYLVTATANGYIKKTPLEQFLEVRSTKNVRCMKIRDDDSLVFAGVILEHSDLMVYTRKGNYVFISLDSISEQAKDSMGLVCIKVDGDDAIQGISTIGAQDDFIAVVTNKGIVKKCEPQYFGRPVKRSASISQSYLTTLEAGDTVNTVLGIGADCGITVCTRTDVYTLKPGDIPIMTRKAKGKKLVPLPIGSNILNVFQSTSS